MDLGLRATLIPRMASYGNVQLERHLEREFESGVKPLNGGRDCVESFLIYVTKPSPKCLLEFATYWMWRLHMMPTRLKAHFVRKQIWEFCHGGLQDLSKQYEGL